MGAILVAALATLAILLPNPALAIPAPDLIVSSVASVSQLLALLSVALGGTVFAGSRIASGSPARTGAVPRLLKWGLLGSLALLLCSAGLNVYQWISHKEERLARLQANLERPSRERGKPNFDPSLRELSYSSQEIHPLGIGSEQLARILEGEAGVPSDYNFLDVRESAETLTNSVAGFAAVRYPDVLAQIDKLGLRGKQNILLCHNGNRSSELCQTLAEQGIPCRFLVGGYQKWFVEGRPLVRPVSRTPENLRSVPRYRNDQRLLDTPEAKTLVQEEGAVFVDVRYPLEFQSGHLPDAINIPLRKMPSAELRASIAALPDRPIVIPCYDRRSCFMGQVLGYELQQAGYDFRGRYTVPHEYFEEAPLAQALPHVAKWRALAQQSLWDRMTVRLSEALSWFIDRFGTILPGLLALALVSRLLVAPFTIKSERDQAKLRDLAPEIAALRERLQGDPKRLVRAMSALHRRHNITPARNLLALGFFPIFIISIAAIELAAEVTPETVLWIEDLAAPDPLFLLPVAFAALICLYIHRSATVSRRWLPWIWIAGVPALTVVMIGLSAAASLYAVISAVLILVQQGIVARALGRRSRPNERRARIADAGIVPLSDAHRVEGTGNKAARLGRLVEAGFPVPAGFVVTGRVKDA